MLLNCYEVAEDIFVLFSFSLSYSLYIHTILFFCTESSDGAYETWAYFLVCIYTFKTNFLNWETEKDIKLFKLANL